jgi:CRP/FNR family transcriptional regulator
MYKNNDIIQDLRGLPYLSGLDSDKLSGLARHAHKKRLSKGYLLFKELETIKYCFILQSGKIKLYKTSLEGRELIIRIVNPGEYICHESLFNGGRYFLNAVTVEESSVIVLPSDNFREVIHGEIGELGLKILEGLSERIKSLMTLVEDLAFRDVEQRIIVKLLQFAEEESHEKGNVVHLSLTHQDIASMTGTVREVVSRTMSKLKKKGVIVESTFRGFKIDRGYAYRLSGKEMLFMS